MKRQPLPTRVTMPPPSVPGIERDVLAHDVGVADLEPARLAAVLEVLRHGSRRSRTGRCGCAHRCVVRPSTTACAPTQVSATDPHVGPDDGVRADAHTVRELGARRHRPPSDGCAARTARSSPNSTSATTASPSATIPRKRQTGRAGQRGHLEPERVARHDGTAEPRALHAARARPARRPATTAAPSCASASHSSTPGTTGTPGEVAREVRLVGADELRRHALARRARRSTTRSSEAIREARRLRRAIVARPYGYAATPSASAAPGAGASAAWPRLPASSSAAPPAPAVVDLHDGVGDVERLVGVEQPAARASSTSV